MMGLTKTMVVVKTRRKWKSW